MTLGAILEYRPVIAHGLWTTVWIASCSITLSALGAMILGPLRLSSIPAIRVGSMLVVELVRGPSAIVWLFWVFYALPLLPGMPHLNPGVASVLVLSVIGAAYSSEIVRAGIEAVQRGQKDACHALGLSPRQSLVKVIMPQALSQIVPAFGSMAADMIKWTSIVSFVGVHDLLYVANNIRSVTYETATVFSLLAAFYWILCLLSSTGFRLLERVLPLNRALSAAQNGETTPAASHAQVPNGTAS